MKTKKIVTIGGGTGQSSFLKALKLIKDIEITSIVSMFDSGGSSGRLRKEFGALPPGDILKCLLALSEYEGVEEIFKYRFKEGEKLKGHTLGNLVLTFFTEFEKDYMRGLNSISRALKVRGKVLPVTLEQADLIAELEDGSIIRGETNIDIPETKNRPKIKNIYLDKEAKICPEAERAIKDADFIIFTYGDLYTSIIPNLLARGAKEAINKSKAQLIHLPNTITKVGETDDFKGEDFVLVLEKYLGRKVDILLVNNKEPNPPYQGEFVEFEHDDSWEGRKIIRMDLLDPRGTGAKRDIIKTSQALQKIIL